MNTTEKQIYFAVKEATEICDNMEKPNSIFLPHITVDDVAEAFKLERSYVCRIMNRLTDKGLLKKRAFFNAKNGHHYGYIAK